MRVLVGAGCIEMSLNELQETYRCTYEHTDVHTRAYPYWFACMSLVRLFVNMYRVHMLFDFRFAFYVCDVLWLLLLLLLLLLVHEYKCCLSLPPFSAPPAPPPCVPVCACVARVYMHECVSLLLCVLVCLLLVVIVALACCFARMNFLLWLGSFTPANQCCAPGVFAISICTQTNLQKSQTCACHHHHPYAALRPTSLPRPQPAH